MYKPFVYTYLSDEPFPRCIYPLKSRRIILAQQRVLGVLSSAGFSKVVAAIVERLVVLMIRNTGGILGIKNECMETFLGSLTVLRYPAKCISRRPILPVKLAHYFGIIGFNAGEFTLRKGYISNAWSDDRYDWLKGTEVNTFWHKEIIHLCQ